MIGAVVADEQELMVDDAAADAVVPGSLLSTHSTHNIRHQSLVTFVAPLHSLVLEFCCVSWFQAE